MNEIDAQIGRIVQAALKQQRIPQTNLGRRLGLDQAAISRRLAGRTAWKVSELLATADLLDVAVTDLLPLT